MRPAPGRTPLDAPPFMRVMPVHTLTTCVKAGRAAMLHGDPGTGSRGLVATALALETAEDEWAKLHLAPAAFRQRATRRTYGQVGKDLPWTAAADQESQGTARHYQTATLEAPSSGQWRSPGRLGSAVGFGPRTYAFARPACHHVGLEPGCAWAGSERLPISGHNGLTSTASVKPGSNERNSDILDALPAGSGSLSVEGETALQSFSATGLDYGTVYAITSGMTTAPADVDDPLIMTPVLDEPPQVCRPRAC